jgi:hypothetical protein
VTASSADPRDERAVLAELGQRLPGYTPEWSPREGGAAHAVMRAFARLAGIVNDRLARAPDRNLLACLDMLGTHLLPAQAARVPLVFDVMSDAPLDVTLPAGSQVAAAPDPVAPRLEADAKPPAPAEPIVFSTERTVTLSRGRVACLYSIQPGADRYADHSADIGRGLTLFDGMKLTPHELYLGHDRLFALGGSIVLIISFLLERGAKEPIKLAWEYYTDSGWVPLPYNLEDDTTGGLTASGQVTLRRECGPNAKKETFAGRESFWLRARLLTPLASESIAPLVTVNDIRARVQFGKSDLLPDAAFADAVALDVSKDFHPFGQTPVLSSAFYLSCKEAFDRAGATVKIGFTLSQKGNTQADDEGGALKLDWEFSTQSGWEPLSVQPDDYKFDAAVDVESPVFFACPSQWAEREVNGVKKRWLRVRISGGDFGRPLRVTGVTNQQPTFEDGNLTPPIVKKALVSFEYLTNSERLHHFVVYNDFVFEDVTEAASRTDRWFVPFAPMSDRAPSVHLGLDRAPPDGLASLYVDVPEQEARSQAASPFVWEYRAADGWRELTVLDETNGFRQSGMIQFIGPQDAVPAVGPQDAVPADGLGGMRYWLRARLKWGEAMLPAPVGGVWLNAVWAAEKRKVERELAGRSDGNPGQGFQLRRTPVLNGETVEVEEWTGRGEAWRSALADAPETEIRFEKDPATGAVSSAWVRWQERAHFYESGPRDRHYVLERATGLLRFGANVPSAGKRIAVTYASGGGVAGNARAGAVKQLRTAAPYISGVTNPIAARGGADGESIEALLRRGPQRLRHRDRALSAQDLEWLALEASPEVARVRCLPLAGPDGTAQRGWVTLLVVPQSVDSRPALSAELARNVLGHIAARVPAGVRVRVVGPRYVAVSVRAVVVPVDAAEAARAEARVRGALDRFLHPLGGGRERRGWMFGQSVHLSQIAALIEGVDGVEHAEDITLLVDGVLAGTSVEVADDALVCGGPHELMLHIGAQ